ncbi:CBS domain containing-hemolysin-like protein [Streptomyces olivoverticillatus]|uniref:CBS domain containing-hemolysin-like protein n=1 Tax=Streptomyces olivoverticillatus TaxID=66427 RepID=A0A7W7PIH3_9ACTN|nr:CBS domain containing-hemolysin-like protein [Streptomyces olivoverticillatus]
MSGADESDSGRSSTNATAALAYVEEQVAHHIRSFSSSRTFYQRRSLAQTVSAAALGALTTFLIGLGQIYPQAWLSAAALASAGLTTVASAWTGWFGSRQAWVINQAALNKLYTLRAQIRFDKLSRTDSADAISPAAVQGYHDRCQEILHEANSSWEQLRLSQG